MSTVGTALPPCRRLLVTLGVFLVHSRSTVRRVLYTRFLHCQLSPAEPYRCSLRLELYPLHARTRQKFFCSRTTIFYTDQDGRQLSRLWTSMSISFIRVSARLIVPPPVSLRLRIYDIR
ncbi:hypothetical protein EDD85DRAFT_841741 [Armillaria nabsnona]|nr:hypothetical protein EDD85DRAFT_841741 [Armillaria nabsnona]